eukprot:1160094-Pelagomonas_calceolata.AAC.9
MRGPMRCGVVQYSDFTLFLHACLSEALTRVALIAHVECESTSSLADKQSNLHPNASCCIQESQIYSGSHVEKQLKEAQDYIKKEKDPEMVELAREDIAGLQQRLEALEQDIKVMLLPRDPLDDRNIMLEIRGGAGGDEAAIWAGDLYRMYLRYAQVSACTCFMPRSVHWTPSLEVAILATLKSGPHGYFNLEHHRRGHPRGAACANFEFVLAVWSFDVLYSETGGVHRFMCMLMCLSAFAHNLVLCLQKLGWKVELLSSTTQENGGYKEVICQIVGDSVYSKLKWEAGVHRVQRVPATEAAGRVHTSTATVAVMPEVDDVDVQVRHTSSSIGNHAEDP